MVLFSKTATVTDEERVQASIDELFEPYVEGIKTFDNLELERKAHIRYLEKGLDPLPSAFVGLDANMPWICYWILQSLDVLYCAASGIPSHLATRVINTLRECQNPTGGFGGGAGQEAHLACTFAAISALSVIGTEEAFKVINVANLRSYLLRMKQPNGSFTMQIDGESDCRGSYCALASASLTGLLGEVSEGSAPFIASCQSYEGGLGAVPMAEAHAGYTYCGFAALVILDQVDLIDLTALANFALRSQSKQSGGFRGRTNKLVDGCYSFWTGALFPLLRRAMKQGLPSFDADGLQKFILVCCQDPRGGLKDKPEKNVDYYHSCYCLAGLNVAQHEPGVVQVGPDSNRLPPIDPAYNLRPERVATIKKFFSKAH